MKRLAAAKLLVAFFSSFSFIVLFAAYVVPVVAARTALLAQFGLFGSWIDNYSVLRGIFSETLGAFVLAAVASALPRWGRVLLAVIWCGAVAMNYEFIQVNNSNALVVFAVDGDQSAFLKGSVFVYSVMFNWALLFALSVATTLIVYKAHRRFGRRGHVSRYGVGAYIVIAALMLALPGAGHVSHGESWLDRGFVEENLELIFSPQQEAVKWDELPEADKAIVSELFSQDLSGKWYLPVSNRRPNILMITVESLSNWQMDQGWMKHLQKEWYPRSLFFKNFISQQRQTHVGIYALMCGENPNLLSWVTKPELMTLGQNSRYCLPGRLRDSGYNTSYLQTAALAFMHKDIFIRELGFDSIKGGDDIPNLTRYSTWGADDEQLYKYVLADIERLEKEDEPWFVNALTVSTHHPYSIPIKDKMPGGVFDHELAYKNSYIYADNALNHLLTKLEDDGVLDNTMVIITSDEARVRETGLIHYHRLFYGNQGFMMVILPKKLHRDIMTPYSQSDLMLSILDYTGLPYAGVKGRSLFRDYETFRPQIFSHIHQKRITLWRKQSQIDSCAYDFSMCWTYNAHDSDSMDLFKKYTVVLKQGGDEALRKMFSYIVQKSDKSYLQQAQKERVFERENVHVTSASYAFFSLLRFTLNKGDTIRWRAEYTINKGKNPDAPIIQIGHFSKTSLDKKVPEVFQQMNDRLEQGKRYDIDISHTAEADGEAVDSNLIVYLPKGVTIDVKQSWVEITRADSDTN